MVKFILKLALVGTLLFGTYKAAFFYAFYRFAVHMGECSASENLCALAERKASNQELTAAMAATYSCARKKQSFVEALFVTIPDSYTHPPPDALNHQEIAKSCRSR